jgi:hypothetical protein
VPGSPSSGSSIPCCSSRSVIVHTAVDGVDAAKTIAAGVSTFQPRATSRLAMALTRPSPIITTIVAACGARLSRIGRYASSACPERTTNPAAIPRCVTGIDASAPAAIAELTPGTTSKRMPAAASASASSPPRPNTNGSPPLRRTTLLPRRAARTINQLMNCWRTCGRPARLPT